MKNEDIKPGMSREDWELQCMHYFDCAFYIPPDAFIFRHYDEKEELKCERGMIGGNYTGDLYFVHGMKGGYYGAYATRDVTFYLKSGTWVELPSAEYFAAREVAELRASLIEAEEKLAEIVCRKGCSS